MMLSIIACDTKIDQMFSQPIAVTRAFMQSLNNNNPSKALDQICESMVVPSLPEKMLKKLRYEELSNDGNTASVQVKGEIRLENEDLGALKKNLEFVLVLQNNDNGWCIKRDSLSGILDSIIDLSY